MVAKHRLYQFGKEGTAKRLVIALSAVAFNALAIVSLVACSPSRTEPPSARVDKLLAEWNKTDSPGCSLAISRNGTLIYEHAYGMALRGPTHRRLADLPDWIYF
jgi:CubicO group peptidase (beta-lactamase class C family)